MLAFSALQPLTDLGGSFELRGAFFPGSPAAIALVGTKGTFPCRQGVTSTTTMRASVGPLPPGTYALTFSQEGQAQAIPDAVTVIRSFAIPAPVSETGNTSLAGPAPFVQAPMFAPVGEVFGKVATAFAFQPDLSNPVGFPVTFSLVGWLPAGLTFNGTTGLISGTPSAAGTSSVQVLAQYISAGEARTSRVSFTITIEAQHVIIPDVRESFEFGTGWSRTVSDATLAPHPIFVGLDITETFENGTGWSRTIADSLFNPNPSFPAPDLVETFETGTGWSGT